MRYTHHQIILALSLLPRVGRRTLSDEELSDWLTDLSNGKFYPADFCMDFSANARKNGTCTKCDANGDIDCKFPIQDIIVQWLNDEKK